MESSELILAGCAVLAVLCCVAGVCESSLVACAHEHGAMIVCAGSKLDNCHFQQGVFDD